MTGNQKTARLGFFGSICAVVALGSPSLVRAQEESLRPGINQYFEDRSLENWIGRFEREGREVYERRDEVLAVLELEPGMTVADIGAGTGFFTMLFAQKVGPEGKVYGVDITKKFVDHLVSTSRELGLKNVEGIRNSFDSTGLEKDSIDVAFICDTYHHFEYPYRMLASIKEALRPGGKVVLVDMERIEGVTEQWVLNMVRAGKGTFTDEFKNAGFELVEEVPFSEKDYILRFRERD